MDLSPISLHLRLQILNYKVCQQYVGHIGRSHLRQRTSIKKKKKLRSFTFNILTEAPFEVSAERDFLWDLNGFPLIKCANNWNILWKYWEWLRQCVLKFWNCGYATSAVVQRMESCVKYYQMKWYSLNISVGFNHFFRTFLGFRGSLTFFYLKPRRYM